MTDVLRLFGPLVLWLASFSAVYGVLGLSCEQGWGRAPVVAAWVLVIALQAAALLALRSPRFGMGSEPDRWASLALGIIGLVAVIWTLFPVVVLEACLQTP